MPPLHPNMRHTWAGQITVRCDECNYQHERLFTKDNRGRVKAIAATGARSHSRRTGHRVTWAVTELHQIANVVARGLDSAVGVNVVLESLTRANRASRGNGHSAIVKETVLEISR